jgi:hypothetical protein
VTKQRRGGKDGGLSRIDTLPEGFAALLENSKVSVGDVIGERYELIDTLGSGAMGQVFVAVNRAIGMKVAVKLLKPELLANPEFRKRFQHEAGAVAAIEHPNVVRFLDLVVGDPTFLVTEYVRGQTLAVELKQQGRLPIERAVAIAVRLCWGLDAAHAAGVIHRDLKPENVLLSPDRERSEVPKLIDFGLAKLALTPDDDKVTRTGQILGTPHYMSPEQISGKAVDPRSDVYSLGCVLYEMIAGRPPFVGSADDVQLLYRQMSEPPVRLSQHAPGVWRELEDIVMRMLAKVPEDRFATTADVAKALDHCIDERRRFMSDEATKSWFARTLRVRRAVVPPLLLALFGAGALVMWLGGASRQGPGLITVSSEPGGATVELDWKRLAETTPTAVRGVAAGKHTVRITREGHTPVEQIVNLAGSGRGSIDVRLAPASHAVEVQTVPSGALVHVDGHLIPGKTPIAITLTDEEFHSLLLERTGYAPLTHNIKPEDREPTLTFHLQAEKQPRGILWVDANRAAEVWLDGGATGLVTPTLGMHVPAGAHQVELRDSSGKTASANVKLAQGEVVHLTLDFPVDCAPAPAAAPGRQP